MHVLALCRLSSGAVDLPYSPNCPLLYPLPFSSVLIHTLPPPCTSSAPHSVELGFCILSRYLTLLLHYLRDGLVIPLRRCTTFFSSTSRCACSVCFVRELNKAHLAQASSSYLLYQTARRPLSCAHFHFRGRSPFLACIGNNLKFDVRML